MNTIIPYIPLLIQGTLVTVAAWLITATISLLLGTCLGILSCRYVTQRIYYKKLLFFIKIYTFIAKGIPAYVQILIAYFVIPALLHINVPGFIAACAALSFCSSGYVTEIVRSGINSINQGQWDACLLLGYPLWSTLKRVILPQTIRIILPALCGELEQLLKSSSLLATIGVIELTRSGMNIISRELNPIPIYLIIACIYLMLSAVIQWATFTIEKRNNYGYR